MKIFFHENSLNIRGTSVAVYDYAFFNQELLNNESVILYNKTNPHNNLSVLNKFKNNFNVIGYDNFLNVNKILKDNKADVCYIIKSGEKNEQIINECPDLVHAVFMQPITEIHGHKYAFISEWLSKTCSNNTIPFVPHMVNLLYTNNTLHEILSIDKNKIIFGRYGGMETFDIIFVHDVIKKVLNKRKDVYFLFMNTNKFISHDNVIFLENNSDLLFKSMFINTCDYMIHARKQGESFGLAIAEFNSKNKRIITFGSSIENSHIDMLGNEAFIYNNPFELENILLNVGKDESFSVNMYEIYNPRNVMNKFKNIFLI